MTRSSAPAGSRWMPVISAPESVVGIAATVAPVIAAIAFAVSITRPPPKATRLLDRAVSSSAAAVCGTWPGSTRWVVGGRFAERRRVAQRPLGAEQVEAVEALFVEQLRRPLDGAAAEDDDPVGVPPGEVAAHSVRALARGLTIGRRFGSTRSRRCS